MKPMKNIFFFLCFFASVSFAAVAPPSKQSNSSKARRITPVQAIQELDSLAQSYRVGKNLTPADEAFNRNLKTRILRGTFDLHELAKLSLAEYWNKLSLVEQQRFVELLTNLLEERSIFAKERAAEKGEGKGYLITYHGQTFLNKIKNNALAKSTIRLPKRGLKFSINYKLKATQEGWKIYDVIMDEASLVSNYRFSFGKIIKDHGYPELVRRMENKLSEFRAKQS